MLKWSRSASGNEKCESQLGQKSIVSGVDLQLSAEELRVGHTRNLLSLSKSDSDSDTTPLAMTDIQDPVGLPRLSPSLSSSVSSMRSSVPKEGALDIGPDFNLKFFPHASEKSPGNYSSDHILDSYTFPLGSTPFSACSSLDGSIQNTGFDSQQRPQAQIRRNSTCTNFHHSREATPPVSVRGRTISAQSRVRQRYLPYTRRGRAAPLELRFAARSLGFTSHTGMTLDDIAQVRHATITLAIKLTLLLQGKVHFVNALTQMPDLVLKKAYDVKRADHDCIAHRVALTLAEIESAERHKDYLDVIQRQHQRALALSSAQLDLLSEILDDREMSDVEDDGGYHRAVYADELVQLTIAEGQMKQVSEVMDLREKWMDNDDNNDQEEDGSSEEDRDVPFMGLPSSDDLLSE